ncbi:unnamed protein product [Calicophoron daubneyi]|uniref:Uncharacterized protein n=1 Tax=Calicophoron daubneyi TaxID=300641 RepID=A0AAV2U1A6_CALDB
MNMTSRVDSNLSVCDQTELFTRTFIGKKYSSFSELTAVLEDFEKVACIHFATRSSVLSCPGDPCIYKSITYMCIYGDFGNRSQSTGLRTHRSKSKMCPVRFSVVQKGGYLTIGPRCCYMTHNHLCSKIEYDLYHASRKLTADEEADLMRLLNHNAPTDNVRLLAQLQFGKYLTNSDISNLRQKAAKASMDTKRREVVVNRTDPIRKVGAYRRKRLSVFCDKRCVISEQNNDLPESITAHQPADSDPSSVLEPQSAECREVLAAKEIEVIHRAQLLKNLSSPALYSRLLDRISALMHEFECTIENSKKSGESNSDTHRKADVVTSHGRIGKSMPYSQTSEKFTEPSSSRVQARDRRYSVVNAGFFVTRPHLGQPRFVFRENFQYR